MLCCALCLNFKVCVYLCVCVGGREREKERERHESEGSFQELVLTFYPVWDRVALISAILHT